MFSDFTLYTLLSLFIKANIAAVIGTVYTIPILPDKAHTLSVTIASIFKTSTTVIFDDIYNNTNNSDDPINERISVFVIVPIMSPPIFIPLLNNSFAVILGFLIFNSLKLDAIDIPTSMQAPSADTIISANNKSLKLNFTFEVILNIIASSFPAPDNLAIYPNTVAIIPASTIPPIVPSAAEILFLFQPPIIVKVNTVIIKQVAIDTNIAL